MPPEVEASFTTIIDSILAASDLDTISEKRIRQGLQQSVEYDITPQKVGNCNVSSYSGNRRSHYPQKAIKALIMRRFDEFDEQRKAPPQTNGHASVKEKSPASPLTVRPITVKEASLSSQQTNGHTNGKEKSNVSSEPAHKAISPTPTKHKQEGDGEELSGVKDSPPPKKKKKVERDSDAAYAAKLQAEENARTRSTRGGGPKAPPVKKTKKSPKKKTPSKVKAEDDSDIDGSGSDVKEKNRNGGFHASLRDQLAFDYEY